MKTRAPYALPMADVAVHPLPDRIENLGALPRRLHALYETDYRGSGYALTSVGKVLSRHRQNVAADPLANAQPVRIGGKAPRLLQNDWALLIGTATPEERAFLVAEAAAGRIEVAK